MIEQYQLFVAGIPEPLLIDYGEAGAITHAIIERIGYRWTANDGTFTYLDFKKVAWARIVPPEHVRQRKLRGEL
jgi:hypothetical protein